MKSILKKYYNHLTKYNPDSLISRIYGLHKVIFYRKKGKTQKKLYFCIMNNVFNTNNKIDYRYDLKGSTHGRTTSFPANKPKDLTIALKDLDFLNKKEKFKIGGKYKKKLMAIIKKDVEFFSGCGIIDYSMLIGVHERKRPEIEIDRDSPSNQSLSVSELERE